MGILFIPPAPMRIQGIGGEWMRGSEIQQAKMAAWILGGVEDRGEERPWFRFPNPAQEKDGAERWPEGR